MVQWLRLCTHNAGGLGLIPGQGARSRMPQLKIPRTATKTRCSQINKLIKKTKTLRFKDIKLVAPNPLVQCGTLVETQVCLTPNPASLALSFLKGLLSILVRQPKAAILKLFHLRTPLYT